MKVFDFLVVKFFTLLRRPRFFLSNTMQPKLNILLVKQNLTPLPWFEKLKVQGVEYQIDSGEWSPLSDELSSEKLDECKKRYDPSSKKKKKGSQFFVKNIFVPMKENHGYLEKFV